jgi:type IX secretion system PorP/SprF family membrane protein
MILCKRKFCFLFILVVFSITDLFGQDAHFSQFYANPLYLNPAFAGSVNCPRVSVNFRDQWPTIPNNFLTFSASYDQHINALRGGIGVLVSADIGGAGILQTYNAGLIYNFRVQATRDFVLQFALQGNFLSTSFNWNRLTFASGILNENATPELPTDPENANISQFNANVGMVGYTPYLYFGLAVSHLLPLKTNFFSSASDAWRVKWTAHVGGKIKITEKTRNEVSFGDISLYPNVIFISQGPFHYLHEGFYFRFYPFTVGTWLRHNFKNVEAFIVSCGIEYKSFKIGYSYDFNLTKLERTGGSHEVSLQYVFPCSNPAAKKKTKRKIPPLNCPKF